MNEYQEATLQTIEDLFKAARAARGKVLDWQAVRQVCTYMQNMGHAIEMRETALLGADNILAAYVNEYGEDLLNQLMAENMEVVDGEVEEEVSEYVEGETGLDYESLRVDVQVEGEEE